MTIDAQIIALLLKLQLQPDVPPERCQHLDGRQLTQEERDLLAQATEEHVAAANALRGQGAHLWNDPKRGRVDEPPDNPVAAVRWYHHPADFVSPKFLGEGNCTPDAMVPEGKLWAITPDGFDEQDAIE